MARFEDLLSAFEHPISQNRWDSPLFSVKTDPGGEEDDAVIDSVVRWICGEESKAAPSLSPTDATSDPPLAQTNLQHDIDRAATVDLFTRSPLHGSAPQEIITRLTEIQREVGSEAVGTVNFGPSLPSLHLDRPITVSGLLRPAP